MSVSPLLAGGMLSFQQVLLQERAAFPRQAGVLAGLGSQAWDGGGPRPAPCSLVSILPLPRCCPAPASAPF